MSDQTYFYPLTDFPNDHFDGASLAAEISAPDSGITVQLVSTPSGTLIGGVPNCAITFKEAVNSLPALDAIVAAHQGNPVVTSDPVEVTNQLARPEDGIVYVVPKPSLFGSMMCDRDFRLNTGQFAAADAFEDLYVNPATNKQESWGEMQYVGCFKDDGGAMVPCVDQPDADANAILSIWDYCAFAPGTTDQIRYELRDGILYVDPNLFADPAAPTLVERFGHVVYAVVAPQIPGSMGGSVRFFDSYLGSDSKSLKVEAISPQAHILDPEGPAGGAGACLRCYMYYPAGTKLSHTMRLVTYRAPGTFP